MNKNQKLMFNKIVAAMEAMRSRIVSSNWGAKKVRKLEEILLERSNEFLTDNEYSAEEIDQKVKSLLHLVNNTCR